MKAGLPESVAWLLTATSAVAAARTRKTAGGTKTIEAEFVSAMDGEVAILRAGLSMHERRFGKMK